jgi:hypothetical protein
MAEPMSDAVKLAIVAIVNLIVVGAITVTTMWVKEVFDRRRAKDSNDRADALAEKAEKIAAKVEAAEALRVKIAKVTEGKLDSIAQAQEAVLRLTSKE